MKPDTLAAAVGPYAAGKLSDAEILPLVHEIFDHGLSPEELRELTLAMIATGERLNFEELGKPVVDKHSTGGVGDKITLILTPLTASYGVLVPQLAGRGLGFTGGTIDKLESIPGWRSKLDKAQMHHQLATVGAFIARAATQIVPADKKLYALRDVTGTVASIPLIASSIMSKKIASGATNLVLDVKWGRGALMSTLEQARELAEAMVQLGEDLGVRTTALVTSMNVPLGKAVGNSIEVAEALEVLSGQGPDDVRELTLALADEMLRLAGLEDIDPAQNLDNGRALATFHDLIAAQGGNLEAGLPRAAYHRDVLSPAGGFLTDLDARVVAQTSWLLGAGRRELGQDIDPTAGVLCHAKPGQVVTQGQKLFTLMSNNESLLEQAHDKLVTGFACGSGQEVVGWGTLITERIQGKGHS